MPMGCNMGPMQERTGRQVTGFVLMGGKSLRMGCDKALLRLATGETLLDRAVGTLRSVADSVLLVGPAKEYSGLWRGEIVEDIYAERGPLGGIHAALRHSTTELNFVLAVDSPYVTRALIEYLVDQARASDALVTVARIDGKLQPLCAVYRRAFAAVAEEVLASGENTAHRAIERTSVRMLTEEELRAAGFGASLFANVNTPEEFEKLRPWQTTAR